MLLVRPSLSILLRPLSLNHHLHPMLSTGTARARIHSGVVARAVQSPDHHQVSTSTTTTASSQGISRNAEDHVLLLEGDAFAVSHDGIARTGYHLGARPTTLPLYHHDKNQVYASNTEAPFVLAIEECYDIQRAHKKFILRHHCLQRDQENGQGTVDAILGKQAVGVAPLGESVGCLNIQEIDQGVFGSAGTGATTWEAAIAMGMFFASNPRLLQGNVMELGCGVGFGSILSQTGTVLFGRETCSEGHPLVKSVTLTDGNSQVLDQCRKNLDSVLASLDADTQDALPPFFVHKLPWELAHLETTKYDTILACDVAYLHTQVDSLVQAMTNLVADNGTIHIFGPYNRGALQQVCRVLQEEKNFDV